MVQRAGVAIIFFGMLGILAADTIPGGDVSGVWFADSAPYYINGNITLQTSDTLTIEPGVLVEFLGGYLFTVQGLLEAIGTETDSITFTASTTWYGLSLTNAPDTCRLEYCVLENFEYFMFSTIYCQNTNPVISHCRISNNESYSECAGITLYNSDTDISYCTISGNTGIKGGGILCHNGSTPTIFKCTITDNRLSGGVYGGGIAIDGGSNPVVDSCIISYNKAGSGGGIAILNGSSCTITDCWLSTDSAAVVGTGDNGGGIFISSPGGIITISGTTMNACYAFDSGGGIYIQDAASVSITRSIFDGNISMCEGGGGGLYSVDCGDLSVDHCDIVNNQAPLGASGIMLNGMTDLTLSNCVFRSQSLDDIWFEDYSSASVTYSDFYDWGTGGPFAGNPPAGLGTLVQTNYNGDSCDIFYNIFIDPLFEDFPGGNYHLADSSPCIDAGDPAFAYDPDSTITDMGVYWYDQTSVAEQPWTRSVKGAYVGATIFAGPLVLPQGTNYRVFDVTGREVKLDKMKCGIYFVEIDGVLSQKIVKVR